MGCINSRQVIFKVLMMNEAGKYEISGYLLFKGDDLVMPNQIGSSRLDEPKLVLLNHWKEEFEPRSYSWKLSQIRSYGYCKDIFMFHSGHRCSHGRAISEHRVSLTSERRTSFTSGRFLFKSSQAKQIYRTLQIACRRQADRMERGFEGTQWATKEENQDVRRLARGSLDSTSSNYLAQHEKVAVTAGPGMQRPVAMQSVMTNDLLRGRVRMDFNPIEEEPTHHDVTYVDMNGKMNSPQPTLTVFPNPDNNNNSFSNPCFHSVASKEKEKTTSNAYSVLRNNGKRFSLPLTSLAKDSARSHYVNCSSSHQALTPVDYQNIGTPTSGISFRDGVTPSSSGISCWGSGEKVFVYPTSSNEDSRRGSTVVEIHEPYPLGPIQHRHNQLSVIYSELEDSETNSSSCRDRRKRPSCSAYETLAPKEPRRDVENPGVAYSMVDVKKTEAIGTTVEDRIACREMSERRATIHLQLGPSGSGELVRKGVPSLAQPLRRCRSSSGSRRQQSAQDSSSLLGESCWSIASFRRKMRGKCEK